MKRYIVIELIAGGIALAVGLLLGGPVLPALGVCTVALAAQMCVFSDKHHWAIVVFGLLALLGLAGSGLSSFLYLTSLSGYANDASPLTVLLVVAGFLLLQSFLLLPLEEREDLALLRRGISRTVLFSALGFAGIVLTYLLSYLLYGSALAALLEGTTVQDFHYLEGVLSLAFVLTSARGVLRGFFGKEPLTEQNREDINVETT